MVQKITPTQITGTIADDKLIARDTEGLFREATQADITALGFTPGAGSAITWNFISTSSGSWSGTSTTTAVPVGTKAIIVHFSGAGADQQAMLIIGSLTSVSVSGNSHSYTASVSGLVLTFSQGPVLGGQSYTAHFYS